MTHDELRSVVLNHVLLAYQRILLEPVERLQPAPVVPLTPEQLDAELPGYLENEGQA